jgi:intraflagellar transport protein 80
MMFRSMHGLQDPSMWACLAAMAMSTKELNTAQDAFAALEEVDKLHFVLKVQWLIVCTC